MRIIDTLIVFRILKLLTTPFNKQKAYKFGFIDKDGKRIKKLPDGSDNKPSSKMEKSSYTFLHRLVFNLKRIIEKVPFGKTQFASYAVALALLKEHCELSDDQAEELYEKFYRYLKDTNQLNPEHITEAIGFPVLTRGTYRLRHYTRDFNDEQLDPRTAVEIQGEIAKVFGISVYEGYVGDTKVYLSAEDVY
jgi:hypothetical protein|tara:strand:+ start:105 stop:680 length:576 start_codon:yes stop_codon:yes gene_type:complete